MTTTEVGLRVASAPSTRDDMRPVLERSAEHELRHQHPGIRDISHSWHTVADDDIVAEGFPGLIGWHFLTATGLVDDADG